MATPCFYTYKGKKYTYDEFASLLHDGELHDLSTKGIIQGDFLKSMPEELKPITNEGKESGDIVANENVSIGTGIMGEGGVAEQKAVAEENISEPINVIGDKGNAKVGGIFESDLEPIEVERIKKEGEQLSFDFDKDYGALSEKEQNKIREDYERYKQEVAVKPIEGGKGNVETPTRQETEISKTERNAPTENRKEGKPSTEATREGGQEREPNRKVEDENVKGFKRESGKSSVLARLKEGGNSEKITKALNELDHSYKVRNQEQVNRDVQKYIKEVGIEEAYNAVKENKIVFNDTKALIYNEVLTRMQDLIDNKLDSITDLQERSKAEKELLDEFKNVSKEFSELQTNIGQGASIMNFIYDKNSDLKYELSKQVSDYKSSNKGEIPSDVLEKFEKATETIKELNDKIKETEKKLQEANERLLVENISESISKEKENETKNRGGLTKREQLRKTQIAKKYFGTLNDITRFATIIAEPEFREYLGLSFKEAKGNVEYFSKKLLAEIGKGAEKYLPEFIKLSKEINEENITNSIIVSEDGKVKIPKNVIYDLIKDGNNDINSISQAILDRLKADNPDLTLREVRDSITGYGERVSKTKTDLEIELSRLKQIGKLESEYEDLQKGKERAKSDIKRREISEKEKELKEKIKQIQDDLGITENRRTEASKKYVQKQIDIIKDRIENKDFAKKTIKPIVEDVELRKLRAEKFEQQEIFNKEQYALELKNRTKLEKYRDRFIGIYSIPRVLLATGEMSFVLIQGGIQTTNLIFRKPSVLLDTFKKAFIAMGSNSKYNEYENLLKTSDNYKLMKESKLALTEANYKMEAREEQFIGDYVSVLWDVTGEAINRISKGKEYESSGDKILSFFGRTASIKRFKVGDKFKNINPLRAIERANSVYMNELRRLRFEDGINMLKKEGKNEIDNKEDYKKLASAINTMTGRANIGRLENINDLLSIPFFSFKNTVSTFNQLNPYFYYSLNTNTNPLSKPSVAQKIIVLDMIRFVGATSAFMLLAQASAGKDDDGNNKIDIELDPRSSDFGKMRMGNIRFDAWHGMLPLVNLYSRMFTNQTIKNGEVVDLGAKYKSDTRQDLTHRFFENKFSPSSAMLWKFMGSKVDDEGTRTDNFGNEYSITDDLLKMQPIYWQSVQDIKKENPDDWAKFLTAIGLFGLNNQVQAPKDEKNNKRKTLGEMNNK